MRKLLALLGTAALLSGCGATADKEPTPAEPTVQPPVVNIPLTPVVPAPVVPDMAE